MDGAWYESRTCGPLDAALTLSASSFHIRRNLTHGYVFVYWLGPITLSPCRPIGSDADRLGPSRGAAPGEI